MIDKVQNKMPFPVSIYPMNTKLSFFSSFMVTQKT